MALTRRIELFLLATVTVVVGACSGRSGAPAIQPGTASISSVDSIWALAQDNLSRRRWTRASLEFERLLLFLPVGDKRIPAAHMGLAEAYLGDRSNLLAAREFRLVADLFPTDSLAPEALIRAGDAYADLWRHPDLDPTDGETALGVYQEVLVRYPKSPAVAKAQAAIAALEDRFAQKSLRTAEYYLKYKAYDSSLIYLRNVVARYPRSSVMPRTLSRMIEIYQLLHYDEERTQACQYFRANFPDAPELEKSCPATAAAVKGSGE